MPLSFNNMLLHSRQHLTARRHDAGLVAAGRRYEAPIRGARMSACLAIHLKYHSHLSLRPQNRLHAGWRFTAASLMPLRRRRFYRTSRFNDDRRFNGSPLRYFRRFALRRRYEYRRQLANSRSGPLLSQFGLGQENFGARRTLAAPADVTKSRGRFITSNARSPGARGIAC